MRRLEPGQALSILGERLREDLDRDLPTQIGIGGPVDKIKQSTATMLAATSNQAAAESSWKALDRIHAASGLSRGPVALSTERGSGLPAQVESRRESCRHTSPGILRRASLNAAT